MKGKNGTNNMQIHNSYKCFKTENLTIQPIDSKSKYKAKKTRDKNIVTKLLEKKGENIL